MKLLGVANGTNVTLHETKNSWLPCDAYNLPIVGLSARTFELTCRAGNVAQICEVVRGHVQRLVLA